MAKDGRSWRVKLHKGVQFHHGYGEFTAKDVVHNHALWCDEQYPGRKDPPYVAYKNGICHGRAGRGGQRLRDRHALQGGVPRLAVLLLRAPRMSSCSARRSGIKKARWRTRRKPAGTGPYIFKERQLDRYVLFERAPTPHWKRGMVDWKELQMTWTLEEPTRLAQFWRGRRTSPRSTRTSSMKR